MMMRLMEWPTLLLMIIDLSVVNCYFCNTPRFQSNSLTMTANYPTKIGQIVSKMTQSTQKALRSRNSRMEIELPLAADFGVEATKAATGANPPLAEKVTKSNREAARLFTEMFSSISSTSAVLFSSENEAFVARNKWGATFRGQVISFESKTGKGYGKLRSRKFSAEEQEQALLGEEGVYIPDGTEVLIVAGPRSKDWPKLKKLTDKLGEGTLVILINGRLSLPTATGRDQDPNQGFNEWLDATFVPVFTYSPPEPESDTTSSSTSSSLSSSAAKKGRELLVYHEFETKWYIGEKEKGPGFMGFGGGGFTTLWEGANRPTPEDIAAILGKK